MQTSVVYLISCTYLQVVGTNQSRRGNDVNLNATCRLMKVHGVCVSSPFCVSSILIGAILLSRCPTGSTSWVSYILYSETF